MLELKHFNFSTNDLSDIIVLPMITSQCEIFRRNFMPFVSNPVSININATAAKAVSELLC